MIPKKTFRSKQLTARITLEGLNEVTHIKLAA